MHLAFGPLELPADDEALATFLTGEEWPFHVNAQLSARKVQELQRSGTFSGDDQRTFWIRTADGERIGLVRLFDLDDVEDGAPRFDLRVRASWRNRGVGRAAVRWLTAYCFDTWPALDRVEGTTRVDNRAMRRTFEVCGYAKEAHYRQSWPDRHGHRHDSVAYGILRRDWLSGTVTPVNFDD